MTDYENNNLSESTDQVHPNAENTTTTPPPAVPEAAPVAEEAQPANGQRVSSNVPNLTLEPDSIPHVSPDFDPHIPGSAAQPFNMPDPPHAPEPPAAPVYQQVPPTYQTPYQGPGQGAPQYQTPQYSQPNQQPYYQNQYTTPPMGYNQKSRLAAGLLAILVGSLGIHNFYLGFNTRATVQLVISLAGGLLTCGVATIAMCIWAFIEGVLLLSGSRVFDGNGVILKD